MGLIPAEDRCLRAALTSLEMGVNTLQSRLPKPVGSDHQPGTREGILREQDLLDDKLLLVLDETTSYPTATYM